MAIFNQGIREITFELFKSKQSFKRRVFRILFRFQFIRNFMRNHHDNKFKVPKILTNNDHLKLKESGFLVKELNFSQSFMNEIKGLQFTEDVSKKVFKNFDEVLNFKGTRAHARYVSKSCHTLSNEVLMLSQRPEIMDIVNSYLGPKAELRESISWISISNVLSEKNFEFGFHMDIASWKWLNVFIYLSDVNELNGAHSCIEGTHEIRHFGSFLDRRLDMDRAINLYGPNRIKVFTGNIGTAIFEDTGNYHRAMPVKEDHRFILQLNYSNYSDFEL